jgi:crotonobetainyl-CoA:carnitine CoA-transferase CaiB-like acyl-CoA transferase
MPADIIDNPQLKARDYWVNLESPSTGAPVKYPKYFFLSNQTRNFVETAAPVVGEYNHTIYGNELKLSEQEIRKLEEADVI